MMQMTRMHPDFVSAEIRQIRAIRVLRRGKLLCAPRNESQHNRTHTNNPPPKNTNHSPHFLKTPPCPSSPASREGQRASPRSAPAAAILNTGEPEGASVRPTN